MKNFSAILSLPLGNLGIQTAGDKLIGIDFLLKNDKSQAPKDHFAHHVDQELQNYLQNPHHLFCVDMHLEGTPFQKKCGMHCVKFQVEPPSVMACLPSG